MKGRRARAEAPKSPVIAQGVNTGHTLLHQRLLAAELRLRLWRDEAVSITAYDGE